MKTIEEFINKYVDRGFGSMTKNDFEIFIFGQLLTMEPYKGKTNYELSLLLRIPETKIKRLRYEAALKNVDVQSDYKTMVYDLLEKAQIRGEEKKIIFQVEDVIVKSYISSILKQDGRLLDSSFNPELIVLHLNDFQYLAKKVYPEGAEEKLFREAQKISKHSTDKPLTWNDILGWVVQGAASGATSAVITSLTPSGLLKSIKNYFQN